MLQKLQNDHALIYDCRLEITIFNFQFMLSWDVGVAEP
jgi:hypothetical protein